MHKGKSSAQEILYINFSSNNSQNTLIAGEIHFLKRNTFGKIKNRSPAKKHHA